MDIFEAALAANDGNKIGAAVDIARGTMAHDPSDPLRMGYGLGAALISVSEIYELNIRQTAVVAERLVNPLLSAAVSVQEAEILVDTPLEDEMEIALVNFGVAP
jgi:hypothetical protein